VQPEPLAVEPATTDSTLPAPDPDEAEILDRAHRSLQAGTPAEVLRFVEVHKRIYPHGVLTQEREAIVIEALVKLGRKDAARAQLEAFTFRYPESSYRWRLQGLVSP
jgi:hypothetical protein